MFSQAGRRRSGVKLAIVSGAVTVLALGPAAAEATDGDPVRVGRLTVGTNVTQIENRRASGTPLELIGLYVRSLRGIGMLGEGVNAGVRASGGDDGVQGISFGKGAGVSGINDQSSGFGVSGRGEVGVYGEGRKNGVSGSGVETGVLGAGETGVYGRGGVTGVFGRSFVENGSGVWGINFLSGPFAFGVRGGGTVGVFGEGQKTGVFGEGKEVGVSGEGPHGVKGVSESEDGSGVLGQNSAPSAFAFGVKGTGNTGVFGEGPSSGVFGKGGVQGVLAHGDTAGVFAMGKRFGVIAVGEVALETHGKLKFDRSGVITVPQGQASGKACGFEVTPNSRVIATIQQHPVTRVGDRDVPLAVGAYTEDGCVIVLFSNRADMRFTVAFLILN